VVASRASIVICTLDRAAHLRRLLDRLATLEGATFEVVIVAGPSVDGTPALLRELAQRAKTVPCPVANLSRSRNLGIAAAAGDVVAFIDDDALPLAPDWLAGLVAVLDADPRLGAVGGPVLVGDGDVWEFEGRLVSRYGEMRAPFESTAIDADGPDWFQSVQGNNCAFRRDALLAIGGFDEAFTYHFDETDVCARLARIGRQAAFAPRSIVRHYRAPGRARRSAHDLDWASLARSDVYFALKNAPDAAPYRLARTLRLARRKYPFREINHFYWEGQYGLARRALYLARWARGIVAGTCVGIARSRRTPLARDHVPPAFLTFSRT
jgi:GT2 family glycosyltransferase